MLKKVVFLDRDGVINRDSPDYIKSWEEFKFLPGSLEAIRELSASGFTNIVVTNQSGIHRGLIRLSDLEDMHRRMATGIHAAGGAIKDIFYCPHTPDEACGCRKPLPGMIHQACDKYPIDLSTAVMVGDSARDIECGQAGGCGRTILVTGGGSAARIQLAQKGLRPDFEAPSLYESVEWILACPGVSQ